MSTSVCLALCGGGMLVAWIGWRDDKRHVAPHWRALVHVGAAVFALYVLGGLPIIRLGSTVLQLRSVGFVIGVVGVVWAVNFYNFMDGIDGIASIQGVLTGVFATVMLATSRGSELIFPSLVIAVACLGFLPWNWSPAKIFMGDVGSGFLGYWFAVLAIASENTGGPPALIWVLLLGVFVFDATVTLLVRLFRGERVYDAHQSHAYQRAAKLGLSHKQVSFCVGIITTSFGALAWWATSGHHSFAGVVMGAVIGMTLVYALLIWRGMSQRSVGAP
jgi:Fuc2NAc and GlcNAc transferase